MFDLKYYNQLAKNAKFHNEYKDNAFSKQNIHILYNGRCNNNHAWDTLINDLPDNDPLKNTIILQHLPFFLLVVVVLVLYLLQQLHQE
jgi:hypothetical protein